MSYLASAYQRAAAVLALALPPDILADCDRLLGGTQNPHERWTMYDTALAHHQHRQGVAMNTTAQAAKIKSIYLQALERSDLRQDKNSTLWQAEFQALVKKLVEMMGDQEYRRWYDRVFPGEDGIVKAYTWADKKIAAESQFRALKAQAQP